MSDANVISERGTGVAKLAAAAASSRRRRRWATPSLVVGGGLLLLFVVLAVASFFMDSAAYSQDVSSRLRAPDFRLGDDGHLLGTDSLGRDVAARIATGARMSMQVAVIAVLLSAVGGVLIGMFAGYFGGLFDHVLMRFTDAVLAIPIVLLALSIMAVRGTSITNLVLVIVVNQWMIYARTARGEVLNLRALPFVTASRSLGASHAEILRRNILPHLLPSAVVLATLNVSAAILLEAALSFLGLGIQPPDPSLGSMLTEGQVYIARAPWLAICPGLALLLLVLSVNLVGDGVRNALDPGLRRRGR